MAAIAVDLGLAAYLATFLLDRVFSLLQGTIFDHWLVFGAIVSFYFASMWSSPMRATPTQFLFGMRVLDEKGETLEFRNALIRGAVLVGLATTSLALFNPEGATYLRIAALAACVPLFLAALTPHRQGLHDILARSIVVNKKAIKSPEQQSRMREFLADQDPQSIKHRRASIPRMAGDLLALVLPVFFIHTALQAAHDKDIRARTSYALSAIKGLQIALETFYEEESRWPSSSIELGASTKDEFPDGGYYELEDHGRIRIRFTVKPELVVGSLVMAPLIIDGRSEWKCHQEGDIKPAHLPASCRY
jgi:uncharacterized RDD family membrane protein YckC